DELTNAGGWVEPRYWSTIMSAGHACRAEMESCNGRDDDCDGMIDEHAVAEICNGVDDDCDGEIDEHASDEICNGADDDCDGQIDEGLSCAPPVPGNDGGIPSGYDGGVGTSSGMLGGSCGCRATGAGTAPPMALVLLGLALLAISARRAR